MLMNLIATMTISVCSFIGSPNAMDPVVSPPPCVVVDPEETPSHIVHCMELSCKKMKVAWTNCEDEACQTAAWAQYIVDLVDCIPAMNFTETINELNDWIIIGYDGENMTYKYR